MRLRMARVSLFSQESGPLKLIKYSEMVKFNCVVLVGVVAAAIGVVSAFTQEEKDALRAIVVPVITTCSEQLKISKEQILEAKKKGDIDAIDSCFYACFFKGTGTMNDQGLYDVAAAKAEHKKFIHGQEDLEKLDAITDTCSAVNDKDVSDGAKGCERAKLLVHCLVDNKDAFAPLTE